MNPPSSDPQKGTNSEGAGSGPIARPRIRLINNALNSSAAEEALMPEAACGCDSNNPPPPPPCNGDVVICGADNVPINVKGCGIYG
jgi:hypothetical protein